MINYFINIFRSYHKDPPTSTIKLLSCPNIFVTICNNFPDLRQLILLESLSKSHQKIIRTYAWDHIIVKIKDDNIFYHVTNNYCFTKYDLAYINMTNDKIEKLTNCDTLDLSWKILHMML